MVNGLQELRINRINGHARQPLVSGSLERQEIDLVAIEGCGANDPAGGGRGSGSCRPARHASTLARMYKEMFAGLHRDPARHLKVTFPEDYDELVLVRDIRFTSMCEHHLLPFSGVAHVAYLPKGCVTGLSKLARVVDEVALRPQVQERMTQTIADLVERELESLGVAVVIEAEHSCMSIRGVRKPGSLTVTSALARDFPHEPSQPCGSYVANPCQAERLSPA